jgi:putative FmdB family regulatory protein
LPSYLNECEACHDRFSGWQSIHDETRPVCPVCAGPTVRVIEAVNTYGVGPRGSATRKHDATESQWDRDMPAYKRLRHDGHQPPAIDGSATLESQASSAFEVETGLRYGKMPDNWVQEGIQKAKDSGWNPKHKETIST